MFKVINADTRTTLFTSFCCNFIVNFEQSLNLFSNVLIVEQVNICWVGVKLKRYPGKFRKVAGCVVNSIKKCLRYRGFSSKSREIFRIVLLQSTIG